MSLLKKTEISQPIILLHGLFENRHLELLAKKKKTEVVLLEGRPFLVGAQKGTKQLLKNKIEPIIISDNMAGFLFYQKLVKEVWLSYTEGDKKGILVPVGGLILGVLGKKHRIPVYGYPFSQDTALLGESKDIIYFNNIRVAPSKIKGYVPLMDWVPGKYLDKVYE